MGRSATIEGDDLGRILINVHRLMNIEPLASSLAEPLEAMPAEPGISGWPSSGEALAAFAEAHAQDGSGTFQIGLAPLSTGATAARLRA